MNKDERSEIYYNPRLYRRRKEKRTNVLWKSEVKVKQSWVGRIIVTVTLGFVAYKIMTYSLGLI